METKLKNLFLSFSIILLISAVTSFTAYNWKIMNNFQKLSIPIALVILGLGVFSFLKQEKYRNLALFFSCFMIGTIFAVFGQIYQTGADSWILFRNWAIFLIIPTLIINYYPLYFLFIIVSSFMTFFYLSLYYGLSFSMLVSNLIPAFAVLIYPFIIAKTKREFNNFFYNTLVIIFYLFFNIVSSIFLIFGFPVFQNELDLVLYLLPLLVIVSIYLVVGKKNKLQIVIPFSIFSIGNYIWSIYLHIFWGETYFSLSTLFFVSFLIWGITITFFIKAIPSIKNPTVLKIGKTVGNFLKVYMLMSALLFVTSLFSMYSYSSYEFILFALSLILIIASIILPKFLDFKEDNVELLSLSVGLFAISNYFILKNLDLKISVLIVNAIFNIIFTFRKSKFMDFAFFPAQYLTIFFLFGDLLYLLSEKKGFILNLILIFVPLIIFSLELIFQDKINSLKNKNKIERILLGNSIFLLFYFSINKAFKMNFNDLDLARRIFIIIISLIIINFDFLKQYILKNTKMKKMNQNIRNNIILSIILIVISYYSVHYAFDMDYLILLILFCIFKSRKIFFYLLNINAVEKIFHFYLNDYNSTLLQKSKHMLISSLFLMLAYFIIKYLVKGVDESEK